MVLFILKSTFSLIIGFLELLMLIRAIMSFVAPTASGGLADFVYNVTEFLISPVRELLERSEFVRNCPLDISFTATFLLLALCGALI